MTGYQNQKIWRIVKGTVALVVLLGAGQSYAECTQGNMTGTWFFNGMTGDTFSGAVWEIDFCKININSTGKVKNSGSSCQYRDASGKGGFNVQGGDLTINSSCAITGKIQYCDGDFCLNLKIDAARLDKGKSVITMVGRINLDPDIVSFFTGVKK